jgi:hypothetical protein
VATPENEEQLLVFARSSTGAQLERICRSFRQVTRPRAGAGDDERWVRRRHLPDGMVRIEAQLLPDEAERVMAALAEARRAARAPGDASAETSENDGPTLADGLVLAAESFLAHGAEARSGGARTQLFVHLHEERLCEPSDDASFRAVLPDGTSLSGATLLRLACDAGLVVAKVDGSGNVLDVGRKRRTIPPAIERALWMRDGGCRFPGCGARVYCDAHHIEHWSLGGATALQNLCLLCHHCHTLVHERGFRIERAADGAFVFFAPDGRPIEAVPRAPSVTDTLQTHNGALGIDIEPHINLSRWDGAPLGRDRLERCVGALMVQ